MRETKFERLRNKLRRFYVRLKWLLFTEIEDIKLISRYIDFLCPSLNKSKTDPIENLKLIVKQSIIKEFSPEIQNSKSFDLLVDAVMHKVQKKTLEQESEKI